MILLSSVAYLVFEYLRCTPNLQLWSMLDGCLSMLVVVSERRDIGKTAHITVLVAVHFRHPIGS